MPIDWEQLPCRHPHCGAPAAGVYHLPHGSAYAPDFVQALCERHFIELRADCPATTIVSCRTEAEARKELERTQTELVWIRNKVYQFRAEALKFQSVREATEAYNEMLERSEELQKQLENARGVVRGMCSLMADLIPKPETSEEEAA